MPPSFFSRWQQPSTSSSVGAAAPLLSNACRHKTVALLLTPFLPPFAAFAACWGTMRLPIQYKAAFARALSLLPITHEPECLPAPPLDSLWRLVPVENGRQTDVRRMAFAPGTNESESFPHTRAHTHTHTHTLAVPGNTMAMLFPLQISPFPCFGIL
jgi:multisubunit Na+/H+ antiporter MnhG subunit